MRILLFYSMILWSMVSCQSNPNQSTVTLSWELKENADNGTFSAAFVLSHQLKNKLTSNNWAIYYNQIVGTPIPESIEAPITIERINGDFWRIAPTQDFTDLASGDSFTITYKGSGVINKEAWGPLEPYLVIQSDKGEEILPVVLHIVPFDDPQQINRGSEDLVPIPTPSGDYENYAALPTLEAITLPPVVPTPVNWKYQAGTVTFPEGITTIQGGDKASMWLQKEWENWSGQQVKLQEEMNGENANIKLETAEITIGGIQKKSGSNAYRLEIIPTGKINITGTDGAGLLYGAQTLIQYLTIAKETRESILPVVIEDYPRYGYRGVHLDVARNFQSAEQVKLLLSVMGAYKLNKLHFHLTDDEGWRIEIPELPELTQIGAFRGHTLTEENYLFPAYGSGFDPKDPNSAGNGYYTQEAYADILLHAQELGIEVIPEIDLPGHARAAIVAMKRRAEKTGDLKYLLNDPEDESNYVSVQNYTDNVICPCQESSYVFIETVIRNILGIYKSVGIPLSTIHIGGDEVPAGVWEKSPACKQLISENKSVNNTTDINYYFVGRLQEMLNRYGLATSGWEEIALERVPNSSGVIQYQPHPNFKGGSVIPYVWNNLWGNQDLGNRLANAGYPVVLCGVTNLYLDMAYNKDPKEPGLTWGGFVNTQRVFSFAPEEVFFSTTEDPMGHPFDRDAFYKDMEALKVSARKNILGIQGQLWSETLLESQRLSYFYFPKLLGLAERAWASKPNWEKQRSDADLNNAWGVFANQIGQQQLPYINNVFGGVNYRIPAPGVKVEGDKIWVNVAFPGLQVRYTTNGEDPNMESEIAEAGEIPFQKGIKLAAFSNQGNQKSKTIELKY